MITTILGFLTSSAFGAIIGGVGAYFTKVEKRKADAQNHKFEYQMARLDIQADNLARAHELKLVGKQIERAEAEGEIAVDILEGNAFVESVRTNKLKTSYKWVEAIRSLMRPLITMYLLILSTGLTVYIGSLIGGFKIMSEEYLLTAFTGIIDQVLFLTMLAIGWWFGSRPDKKK